MFALILCVFAALQLALAKTVTYNWNIAWTTAAPDGFERPVIGINGQWPCPTIDVNKGDRIVVHVTNGLGNQSTSIHWHGIHQNGTNYMDGATAATQCPIPPGGNMTYDFMVCSLLQSQNITALTRYYRPTSQARIGTTRTTWASTQMASGAR